MEGMQLHQSMTTALSEFDEKMRLLDPKAPSMTKLWEQVWEFKDPNEMVHFNFRQTQALLQRAYQEYYDVCAMHKKILKEMYDQAQGGYDLEKQILQRNDYKEAEERSMKSILDLTKISTSLAKEYRQCAISKAFFVHITKIEQLILFVKRVLSQEIPNIDQLKRIADKIEQGSAQYIDITGEEK